LYEVVGNGGVHRSHTCNVNYATLARLVRMPRTQLLGQLAGSLRINHADDRQASAAAHAP